MRERNLNPGRKRRTPLGLALEKGAKEILSHVKGEARLPVRHVALPGHFDVKRIRTKVEMS